MKTKSIKSPGSLVVRGSNYYAFWRHNGKAICRALRNDNGAAITMRPEAEKAKARLMEIVNRENEVKTLRSIQHAIDDKQTEIASLKAEQNPPLPLSQAWSTFVRSTERHQCGKSTLRDYESKWSIFEKWMQRERRNVTTLQGVDCDVVQAYLENLNQSGVANATFNGHLNVLRYIFRILKDKGQLVENIWEKPKTKPLVTQSRRELTIDELKVVCDKAKGELRTLFCIGLYTGLRLGDCATLRWCEVDLRRNQIQRVARKTALRSPKPITLPIHPSLFTVLNLIPANERKDFVLPRMADIYLNGSRSLVTTEIQRHFDDCGIETTRERENGVRRVVEVGFHSLRHSFVSMCRSSGVALSVVESLVGHSSVDMTRHYTHTSQLAAQNAVALLPSITGHTEPTKPTNQTRDELLRELIESMTTKNLRDKKAAALALLATPTAN
jgi:integrase